MSPFVADEYVVGAGVVGRAVRDRLAAVPAGSADAFERTRTASPVSPKQLGHMLFTNI